MMMMMAVVVRAHDPRKGYYVDDGIESEDEVLLEDEDEGLIYASDGGGYTYSYEAGTSSYQYRRAATTKPHRATQHHQHHHHPQQQQHQHTHQHQTRRTRKTTMGRLSKRAGQRQTQAIARPEIPSKQAEGDTGFLKRLGQFRAGLFYDGERVEKLLDQVLASRADTHLTTTPVAKWLPIECKVIPLYLKKERVIHSGRRNTVYEMSDPLTGKRYAYKTFQKPDEYTAEINFNMFSRHPFIAKAVCIQPLDDQAGIVFELVDGMSSMSYVRKSSTTPNDLLRISAQLLLAMEYVHWLGFVHADLKPENVMIDGEGNIKVIDFGFAIPLPFYKTNRGTPTTIAPELVQAVVGPVHEGIDWWAYGSTLAIWYGLQLATHHKSRKFVPVRVDRSEGITFGRVPESLPDDLRALLYLCLTPNPDRRQFNTRQELEFLKRLPFFRKFSWPDFDLY